MNPGPSGVRPKQEVTQAEIILHWREWRNSLSLSVWAHTDNQSSVYPQTSYSRGMIIVFISHPIRVLKPPTMKRFSRLYPRWQVAFYQTLLTFVHTLLFKLLAPLQKNICLLWNKEAAMSVSFEEVNLTTCGSRLQSSVWQWLKNRVHWDRIDAIPHHHKLTDSTLHTL